MSPVIECMDAIDFMSGLQPGSVDLIITDPPYESIEKHRSVGTTTRLAISKESSNKWFKSFPNDRFPEFFKLAYRALKNNSHLYVFCDQETAFLIKPMGEAAGFKFWKPIVWDKVAMGLGYHYRARYEFILFFEKGKRRLTSLGIPDVLSVKRIRGRYPTEKPLPLLDVLVQQSSSPGELVVDPFCGSGTTLLSAVSLGRSASGCDVSREAVDIASGRVSAFAVSAGVGDLHGEKADNHGEKTHDREIKLLQLASEGDSEWQNAAAAALYAWASKAHDGPGSTADRILGIVDGLLWSPGDAVDCALVNAYSSIINRDDTVVDALALVVQCQRKASVADVSTVSGEVTGRHGDILVFDDLAKSQDARQGDDQ